jgi:predicted dehydrogenase
MDHARHAMDSVAGVRARVRVPARRTARERDAMPHETGDRAVTRRHFMTTSGVTLAGVGLLGPTLPPFAQTSRTGGMHAGEPDGDGAAGKGGSSSLPDAAQPAPPRAVGRPMPALEQPLPDAPDRRLGWCVVGLGDFAINHMLPAIARSRHNRITALASGNADKLRTVAQAYGVPAGSTYSYETFDRIRDDARIDVVYIVLPNALHADFTVRAAQAGKHVFCEKPMAVTEAECRRMIDACATANRRLMIAYRAPFEPHNAEAIRRLRAGELGAIRELHADHGRQLEPSKPVDEWRAQAALAGGGSLYDIGIYSVNGARYLLNEEPVEVRAVYRKPPGSPGPDGRPIDVEQGIAWTMRYASGIMAHCSSGYDYRTVKRMQVFAEQASLQLDPATEYEGNRLIVLPETSRQEPALGESSRQFTGEVDEFALAIRENREPVRGSGAEGLQDVRIMQAIYESARTGRAVPLPGR